jgi:hypothetical protein
MPTASSPGSPIISINDLISPINPLVAALLRSPLHFLASKGLLLLSWNGRRSGRTFSIPVGYQRDGNAVIVLISKPGEKTWWKNFREPWAAKLLIRRRLHPATGECLKPGSREFFEWVETTLRQLPWMGSQLGIEYRRGQALDEEQRAVLMRQCGVVRFELGD